MATEPNPIDPQSAAQELRLLNQPPDYSRTRSLSKEYHGLRLDENALFALARIVSALPEKYGGELIVDIETGEEKFRAKKPEFFLSAQMPLVLKSIVIRYDVWRAPVNCSLTFDENSAKLSLEGTDTDMVAAKFHDLDRELQPRRSET